jgi:hypothetical protein
MIKKQLYTIQTTLKSNMLLNYDRNNNLLANNQRLVNICNKLRDEDIIYIQMHQILQTENFDKYFNTRFNNVQYLSGLLEDDDDF